MSPVLLGILVYIVAQLAIGLLVSRRIRSEADYLLAGRSLGYGLALFSIFATWFGAETCIGSSGAVYEGGLAGASTDPFGYSICLFLMGAFFAIPLWRRKLTTLADLFRQRYSAGTERFAAILMFPTSVLWAAAQIRAFGHVLAASSTLEVELAITLAAGVVIAYTVTGGLLADAMTDVVQGIALLIGLPVVLFAAVNAMGGWSASFASIAPERLNPIPSDMSWIEILDTWAIPICGSVIAQELIARVIATKTPHIAQRASLWAGGLYLAVGLIPVFVGLIGLSLVPGLESSEQILPELAQTYLSPFLYILFAGALVSAILSTVDSALLAASALLSHNVLLPYLPRMSEASKVRMARGGVMLLGIVAYVLALHAGSVYELVEDASAFGSAGIFIIVIFGLFTRFGNATAAIATLATGMLVWLAGTYLFEWPYAYVASLGSAAVMYVAASLLSRATMPLGSK